MITILSINAVIFFFAVFALNWSGAFSGIVRFIIFSAACANVLQIFKILNPSLNWGF